VAQLLTYGAYTPRYRLSRTAIAAALQTGGGSGWRAVASFDEDSTSMAVEAATRNLGGQPGECVSFVSVVRTERSA